MSVGVHGCIMRVYDPSLLLLHQAWLGRLGLMRSVMNPVMMFVMCDMGQSPTSPIKWPSNQSLTFKWFC